MGDEEPKVMGRYALFGEVASGGMATVGFSRTNGEVYEGGGGAHGRVVIRWR